MPTLTVIAGPNGSGKSTLTRSVSFVGRDRLLDPDKFYDNSGDSARLVLVAKAGIVVWQAEAVPEWVRM